MFETGTLHRSVQRWNWAFGVFLFFAFTLFIFTGECMKMVEDEKAAIKGNVSRICISAEIFFVGGC